jgi:hypothetical protein
VNSPNVQLAELKFILNQIWLMQQTTQSNPRRQISMRSSLTRVEHQPIPDADAVAALARILTAMNGPSTSTCDATEKPQGDDEEDLGYQIAANAILDQLAAKGFLILRSAKHTTLGPKVRDTAAARFTFL